jgi:hypothetical protein
VPIVRSVPRPNIFCMLRRSGLQHHVVLKLSPNNRALSVGMRMRDPHGMDPANRLGSLANCFRKKYSRCLPRFQRPPFDHGLGCRDGTQAGFGKATARIHGIGRLWHCWLTFRRRSNARRATLGLEILFLNVHHASWCTGSHGVTKRTASRTATDHGRFHLGLLRFAKCARRKLGTPQVNPALIVKSCIKTKPLEHASKAENFSESQRRA